MMDVVIALLYITGMFFNVAAVVGILRMPDLYCRLHSSSKNTTLGSILIVFGVALQHFRVAETPGGLKVLLVAAFMLIVTPIGSHALARAAYKIGVPMWEDSVIDQSALVAEEGTPGNV